VGRRRHIGSTRHAANWQGAQSALKGRSTNDARRSSCRIHRRQAAAGNYLLGLWRAGIAIWYRGRARTIREARNDAGEPIEIVDTSAAKPLCDACVRLMMAGQQGDPMALFWVSFADRDSGEPLGACIVEADDSANDVAVAEKVIDLGLSPGRGAIAVRRLRDDEGIANRVIREALSGERDANRLFAAALRGVSI
jgi:hypothetical protein